MADTTTEGTDTGQQGTEDQQHTFTQADLDQTAAKVRAEERRKASEKYADYDALKARADGAKTIEDRLAEMEKKTAEAVTRALRSDIAAKHGISAEDRDLFLTGADEASLNAQAERLAARDKDAKKTGNRAPREGTTKTTGDGKDSIREFTRDLFGDRD